MSFHVSDPSWWRVAGSLGRQSKNKGLFSSKDGTLLSEDTAILKGDMPEARKRFRGTKRASDFAWWGISLWNIMIQGSHIFHSDTQQLVSDHRTMWLTHSPTMCRRHMTNVIRWPFPSFCKNAFEWRSQIKRSVTCES